MLHIFSSSLHNAHFLHSWQQLKLTASLTQLEMSRFHLCHSGQATVCRAITHSSALGPAALFSSSRILKNIYCPKYVSLYISILYRWLQRSLSFSVGNWILRNWGYRVQTITNYNRVFNLEAIQVPDWVFCPGRRFVHKQLWKGCLRERVLSAVGTTFLDRKWKHGKTT